MPRDKVIKIGGLDYTMILMRALKDPNNKDLWGAVDFSSSSIQVEENMNYQLRGVTFWHEILHIMFEQGGLEKSETTLDVLAYSMYQLMQSNPPEIFEFIQQGGIPHGD
jgi:hypothetical protein